MSQREGYSLNRAEKDSPWNVSQMNISNVGWQGTTKIDFLKPVV
jgi:hypothetical protein